MTLTLDAAELTRFILAVERSTTGEDSRSVPSAARRCRLRASVPRAGRAAPAR